MAARAGQSNGLPWQQNSINLCYYSNGDMTSERLESDFRSLQKETTFDSWTFLSVILRTFWILSITTSHTQKCIK